MDPLAPPTPPRVIITGAALPLGMALVRASLAAGHRVVAIAPRPDRVPVLTDLARSVGAQLEVHAGDGTVGSDAARVLEAVGPADVLLHAALRRQAADGLVDLDAVDTLDAVDEAGFARLMAANAWATLAWVRAAAPLLRTSSNSRVVVLVPWLASVSIKMQGGDYAYCSSLAARLMVTRSLANDLAPAGIAVHACNPGNYKVAMEGPAFQHTVLEAAEGVVQRLAEVTLANGFAWRDWNGATRA
jgi:NAD(P)-dependent dehydrogenase (short-subunit alcohol dehydrogenase family)